MVKPQEFYKAGTAARFEITGSITGTHDPPTSRFLKLHAGTVILALWFFGCTAVVSPVFIFHQKAYVWFLELCIMISLSTVKFSVTRK